MIQYSVARPSIRRFRGYSRYLLFGTEDGISLYLLRRHRSNIDSWDSYASHRIDFRLRGERLVVSNTGCCGIRDCMGTVLITWTYLRGRMYLIENGV